MYHDRVKILGGIDVDKIYKYESTVCSGCYDVLMMDFGLENITILNAKGAGYKYIIWNLNRIDAINRLKSYKFDDGCSLYVINFHVLMINDDGLMMFLFLDDGIESFPYFLKYIKINY